MTFAQLLEAGYTIEECVAVLEGLKDVLPTQEHLDDSADHAEVARNGENWWKDSR